MISLSAAGIVADFDPDCGFIRGFCVTDGRPIAPLHRAPWVGNAEKMPADAAPHLAGLEGDFFCAPFGQTGPAPLHGWPANGQWAVAAQSTASLRLTLNHPVQGADVSKELTLRDGHPFLYQSHRFTGGTGAVPVANHAMVSLPHGGLLRFSPKRWFETPATPIETDPARGRSCLAYPARSVDPTRFPAKDGGWVDLTRYPFGPAHEDFVAGLEQPGNRLGWTAVTRPVERDLFLSLRNAAHLPMTMLWHSNGGRDFAPWSGRHRNCLGVEEGVALPMLGLSAQEVPDPLTAAGQPGLLLLDPAGAVRVRHVIGAIDWPSGEPVAQIALHGDHLAISGEAGARRELPIWGGFLAL